MVLWVWLPDYIALNVTGIDGAQLMSNPPDSNNAIGNGVH